MYIYIFVCMCMNVCVCVQQELEVAAAVGSMGDEFEVRVPNKDAAMARSLSPFINERKTKKEKVKTSVKYPSEVDAHCTTTNPPFEDWAHGQYSETFGERNEAMPGQMGGVLKPACKGSRMSVLEAALRIVSIKHDHPTITERALETIVQQIQDYGSSCLPVEPGAGLGNVRKFRPATYAEAKAIVNSFGQGVQVIDRCESHCCLYIDDKADLLECPTCSKPRFPPACGATTARHKRRANFVFLKFDLIKSIQSMYRQSAFASKIQYFAKWHGARQKSGSTDVDAIYCGSIFKKWLKDITKGWSY